MLKYGYMEATHESQLQLTDEQLQIIRLIGRVSVIHAALLDRPGAIALPLPEGPAGRMTKLVSQGLGEGESLQIASVVPSASGGIDGTVSRHPASTAQPHTLIMHQVRQPNGRTATEIYRLYMSRTNPRIMQPRQETDPRKRGALRLVTPLTAEKTESRRWRRLADLVTRLETLVQP